MGLRVATNVQSLAAQRNLNITNDAQKRSLEKLASGTRIVRSADDAAGLAISENMRAQIRSIRQAVRNAIRQSQIDKKTIKNIRKHIFPPRPISLGQGLLPTPDGINKQMPVPLSAPQPVPQPARLPDPLPELPEEEDQYLMAAFKLKISQSGPIRFVSNVWNRIPRRKTLGTISIPTPENPVRSLSRTNQWMLPVLIGIISGFTTLSIIQAFQTPKPTAIATRKKPKKLEITRIDPHKPGHTFVDKIKSKAMAPKRFQNTNRGQLLTVTVIKGRVNLRAGPGTHYPIVGTAIPKKYFQVHGFEGLWFRVSPKNNPMKSAWIRNDQVDIVILN